MRDIGSRLLLASLLAVALAMPATATAEELSGRYHGIDEAAGAAIVIEPAGDGYRGTFFDRHGNSQEFRAERVGDAAKAELDMDQRRVLLLVDPLPFGAKVTLVPFDEQGRLDAAAGRLLDFVRAGLDLPEPDPDFVPAPENARGRVTANSFLASYEFWTPTGVRNGYLSLPDKFRTLMRLFPAVQLDVIWKLCLAPDPGRALTLALRGQGVTCAQVVEGMAAAQRTGRFDQFKADVREEKEILRLNVRCGDVYPESRSDCQRAARELSAQAVALETAATVLARYR